MNHYRNRSFATCTFYQDLHLTFGHLCPMFDLDLVLIESRAEQQVSTGMHTEFDLNGMSHAMIEAKHINAGSIDMNGFQFRCHRNLADKADLPLWCVVYCPLDCSGTPVDNDPTSDQSDRIVHWQFLVYPANDIARIRWNTLSGGKNTNRMTAQQYVRFEYWLRGLAPRKSLLSRFSGTWIDVREPRIIM
jgi:hypothetical protein